MDSENPSRGKGTLWIIVFLLLLVLIGYVLSPGPVLPLYQNKPYSAWLDAFYAPLRFGVQNVPAIDSFYRWYLPIWEKKPTPKA